MKSAFNGFSHSSQGFVSVRALHKFQSVIQTLCEFCQRLFCFSTRFECFSVLSAPEVLTGRFKVFREVLILANWLRRLISSARRSICGGAFSLFSASSPISAPSSSNCSLSFPNSSPTRSPFARVRLPVRIRVMFPRYP